MVYGMETERKWTRDATMLRKAVDDMVTLVDRVERDLSERASRIRHAVTSTSSSSGRGGRRLSDMGNVHHQGIHSGGRHRLDRHPGQQHRRHSRVERCDIGRTTTKTTTTTLSSRVDGMLHDAQRALTTYIRTDLCRLLCDDIQRIHTLEQTRLRHEVVRVAREAGRQQRGDRNGKDGEMMGFDGVRGRGRMLTLLLDAGEGYDDDDGGREGVREMTERRVRKIDGRMERVRRMRFVQGLEEVRRRYVDMLRGIRERYRANEEVLTMVMAGMGRGGRKRGGSGEENKRGKNRVGCGWG